MTSVFSSALVVLALLSPLRGGGDHVTVRNNGKEIKALSEVLFIKPGSYKAGPKTEMKRTDIGEVEVTTPSDGLESTDSVRVELIGYSGANAIWRSKQHVLAGQAASFDAHEAANKDFNPTGKQPNMIGKFNIEVAPLIRANQKGAYTASIMVK